MGWTTQIKPRQTLDGVHRTQRQNACSHRGITYSNWDGQGCGIIFWRVCKLSLLKLPICPVPILRQGKCGSFTSFLLPPKGNKDALQPKTNSVGSLSAPVYASTAWVKTTWSCAWQTQCARLYNAVDTLPGGMATIKGFSINPVAQ